MVCPRELLPPGTPAQVLIATSKKKFHHAVDRNRVKRLTRECYRLHKPTLYQYLDSHDTTIVLALNYIHNEILSYQTLNHKFDRLTSMLIEAVNKQLNPPPSHQP